MKSSKSESRPPRTHQLKASALWAGVAVIVIAAATLLAVSPVSRVRVFGAWGYEHLTTLDQKIAMINNSQLGRAGVVLPMGSSISVIPFTGEIIGVERTSPIIELSLVDEGRKTRMTPDSDGLYRYTSHRYPIRITITAATIPGDPLPLLRLRAQAEPAR